MDCIFCAIIKKEIPGKILYEDENTLAMLDKYPKAPGHAIVFPKTHAETILDLDNADIAPTFCTVKKVTRTLQEKLSPDGFTIGFNHGTYAGQTVPHLHIHIIPRFEGDRGRSIHEVVNNPPEESVEEMQKKILNTKS